MLPSSDPAQIADAVAAALSAYTAPRFLIYTMDGEPYGYTLGDYAKAVEVAHYSGGDVSRTVWAWNGGGFDKVEPTRESTGYGEDDYATLTVTLRDEHASIRIDGRA
jgi:hypothetical protein